MGRVYEITNPDGSRFGTLPTGLANLYPINVQPGELVDYSHGPSDIERNEYSDTGEFFRDKGERVSAQLFELANGRYHLLLEGMGNTAVSGVIKRIVGEWLNVGGDSGASATEEATVFIEQLERGAAIDSEEPRMAKLVNGAIVYGDNSVPLPDEYLRE